MVHSICRGVICYNLQIKLYFFSLKIFLVLANSVDPDEMPHCAAFHLGLQCLSKVHIFQSSYFICNHLQSHIYIHTITDLTNMFLNFLVMYSLTSFLPSFVNYIRLCLNILSIPYVS